MIFLNILILMKYFILQAISAKKMFKLRNKYHIGDTAHPDKTYATHIAYTRKGGGEVRNSFILCFKKNYIPFFIS